MSGENHQQRIAGIIDEMVSQNTFSLEILDKIKSLRDNAASLQKENELQSERIEEQEKTISDLRIKNREVSVKLSEWIGKADKLQKEERENEKVRYEKEYQEKRANEIKELFGIVFRNPVWQESVSKNIPIVKHQPGYSDYTEIANGNEFRTKEIK